MATLARNFLFDGLVSLLPPAAGNGTDRENILLIRLDAIGDFVLWLDAANALRTLYPPDRYRLVLLGNDLWTDLATLQPCFDEVIPVNGKRCLSDLRYRLSLWRRLRGIRWAVAINPTYSRHFPYDDAAVRACGAKERIGFQPDLSNQRRWEVKISSRWYSRLVQASPGQLMELERNAEFVRALGLPHFHAALPKLVLPQRKGNAAVEEPYFVVVPGASLPLKQWPLENFAEIVRRVWNGYGLKCVICGSPDEKAIGDRLRALLRDSVPQLEDLTGTTSLAAFAEVIKGAGFVVGNDSSAIHIAAAVGTRAFCLVGGGHYGRFVPYRVGGESEALPVTIACRLECYHCNLQCRYAEAEAAAPCLSGITVDEVWNKVQTVLDAAPHSERLTSS